MLGQLFRNLIILRKLLYSPNAHIINWRESYGQKKRREVATEDNQMNAVTFLYLI